MEYTEKDGGVLVTGVKDFSPEETFECGQCFRAFRLGGGGYYTIALGKLVTITRKQGALFFGNTDTHEFEQTWAPYLDLNRDYGAIKETLAANDFVMRDAVEFAPGIRILKQEFFECLISYIISQNNRIPMIRRVVKNISEAYGEPLGEIDGETQYSFPTLAALRQATEQEFRALKTGFRDKYIVDACEKLSSGEICEETLNTMNTEDARKLLMSIKGVGRKVADCVLLFSLGRLETFPTDVWVKRVMSHFYFSEQAASIDEIHTLAAKKFGAYAGFAQEYLFYYARSQAKNLF